VKGIDVGPTLMSSNLAHLIDRHAGDRVALISRGRPTTYDTLRRDTAALRGGLAGLGVQRGDTVALLCGNGRYFVESYLAVLGLGAIAVPLNPTSPGPEIGREIVAVGASVVVVEPMALGAFGSLDRSSIPTVRHVIVTEGSNLAEAVSFDSLTQADPVPVVEVDDDTIAALIFTSGTAGAPRAAMLSHGNLLSSISQSLASPAAIHQEDVVFGVLPLNHIFGLNVVLGLTLAAGATVVLVQRFDPSTAADTIRERGITVLPGGPPMWLAWAHWPGLDAATFATVRLGLSGAAKLPEQAALAMRDRFGVTIAEGYGLTEASPTVTTQAGIGVKFGSIGRVVAGVEVRLVDERGDDALHNDAGEIWVHGPNVFKGYWHDADATARALTPDGWLRTGDIAVTDSDGYLYLVDRVKDLIIVSGFNVYPAEVEDVLAEHPGVADVAVVGVPHPHSGEAVKAFVVPATGVHLDEEQLIAYCADNLARYKCPTKIMFVEQLPRNASGKILRRELR
jgi:long-chain acyl-CoA synthetase